jgi:hypothetical protein
MPSLEVAFTWDGQPASPAPRVTLSREGDTLVVDVRSPVYGAAPVPGPPARHWQLWEHEVVEVFIAGPGAPADAAYIELELAPSGHWLALRLQGTRNIVDKHVPVGATARIAGGAWSGQVRMPIAALPTGPLRVLATAAHGPPGDRRYLAHVPLGGETPDFHQLPRFTALELG